MGRKSAYSQLIYVIVFIALVGGLAYAGYNYFSNKDRVVVAEVNDMPIYLDEINAQINQLNPSQDGSITYALLDDSAKKILVKEVAAHKLISDYAENVKLDETAIDKKVARYKEDLIKEATLQAIGKEAVTEQTLAQHYAQLQSELEGQTEVHLKHILLSSEKDAKNVIKTLNTKRKSFEDLAKEKSIDKPTGATGGDLGYAVSSLYVKEFSDAALALKNGQYTKTPVKTQFGWHVIKRVDSRPAQVAPFDQIKDRLATDIEQQAIKRFISSLIHNAKIEFEESDDDENDDDDDDHEDGDE